jgi:membrane protease subunit HflC
MTNNKISILSFISLGLMFLLANSIYILDQRQYDIVIQFGDVIREDTSPGLKFKIPFMQNTVFFDNRIQTLVFSAGDDSEVVSSDQKTMKLNAFSKFKIADPLKFFITVRDENTLRGRMIGLMESAVREVIGSTKFNDVLGANRTVVMEKITAIVKEQMLKFGIEVLETRITRVALPEKARDAVYSRMRAEREKEANEIRATGAEEGQKISSDAEKQKAVMIAEAKKQAQTLTGEAEGSAIKIISEAVEKDIDFFDFYRSMEAYRNSFGKEDTKIVLGTDNPFLKYFEARQ